MSRNEKEELLYKIAVTLIPGIGDVLVKNLVAYCGGTEAVFREKKRTLVKIPGVGEMLAGNISSAKESGIFQRAGEEIEFIKKEKITALFYLDDNYPDRLKFCEDAPAMLYFRGRCNVNEKKILGVVGSRKATAYGKTACEKIIGDLKEYEVLIVSGLAYGIDTIAHRTAVENGLDTIGILAHGLDTLYPAENISLSKKMGNNGGLLTEFTTKAELMPELFPRRNRIVAGMSDAVVVIEAARGSGALITAEIANSYNREVFAVPGRVNDKYSEGCNWLIKTNRAAMVESAKDIEYQLGWEQKKNGKSRQKELFVPLNPQEETLVNVLKEKGSIHIDDLCRTSGLSMNKVSSLLLQLEFAGIVKSLPGKVYQMN